MSETRTDTAARRGLSRRTVIGGSALVGVRRPRRQLRRPLRRGGRRRRRRRQRPGYGPLLDDPAGAVSPHPRASPTRSWPESGTTTLETHQPTPDAPYGTALPLSRWAR